MAGLPHSGISGSTPADGSPKLFAAFHALHRLVTPRHPPCAFPSSAPRSRTTPSRQDRLCSPPLFCFQRAREPPPPPRSAGDPEDLPSTARPWAHHPGQLPTVFLRRSTARPAQRESSLTLPNKNGPTPSDRQPPVHQFGASLSRLLLRVARAMAARIRSLLAPVSGRPITIAAVTHRRQDPGATWPGIQILAYASSLASQWGHRPGD